MTEAMQQLAPAQDGAPVLELHGLEVRYPVRAGLTRRWLRAVDGVDMQIRAGECLGLVGESGCGKSTLAQAVMGLVAPSAGTLRLGGLPLGDDSPAERRRRALLAQMVFQDPFSSLNPRQSVGETLAGPLRLHGLAAGRGARDARVRRMLDLVGLPAAAADRMPHEFSGGQRQRIAIARALIVQPRLVVCDEPVSALDVSIRAQIINLLLDLKTELGIALLMISHDLGVVEHMSDRIAVMYLGRIVEQGDWREIFTAPAHPYTRQLIASIPDPMRPGQGLARMRGEAPSALAPPAGCAFHPRCDVALAACARGGVPDFTKISQSHKARCHLLEDTAK